MLSIVKGKRWSPPPVRPDASFVNVCVLTDLEKRVREGDVVDPVDPRVDGVLGIDVEEHRHVDLFAWAEPLLLKAETLYFIEVLSHLLGASRCTC